jgi:hypothetical protein
VPENYNSPSGKSIRYIHLTKNSRRSTTLSKSKTSETRSRQKGRKPGKTRILTDTPEKLALEEEYKKRNKICSSQEECSKKI